MLSCASFRAKLFTVGLSAQVWHAGWRSAAKTSLLKYKDQLEKAKEAREQLLKGDSGRALVHALFANFLTISPPELEEWLVESPSFSA